jgi:quinol monooxygenase YgiN
MIIVGGTFELDPSDREKFIESRRALMHASRAEPGCLEYAFCVDPIDPRRVVLFERWESQDALDTHMAVLKSRPRPAEVVKPISASVVMYDVSGERQFS